MSGMMAFDHLFREVARREYLAVTAMEVTGKPATLLFREFYCAAPRCDCRRVVLMVDQVEGRRIAASINYAFEKPRRGDEPQMYLDPLNPQSEMAEAVLALYAQVLADHPEHRERLERHYAMWKRVVDDPSHPDHRRVRTPDHDDPSFRPAFFRRKARPRKPRPSAQEGSARPATAGTASLTLFGAKKPAESKAQQQFRRLLDKVERLRRQVRDWSAGRPAIDRELALFASQSEAQRLLCREVVFALDRAHGESGWTKADRRRMSQVIVEIARDLLADGDPSGTDSDLVALHDRHGRGDFEAEAAAEEAMHVEVARSVIEAMGIDLGDADVSSMDELRALARAQVEADAAAEEERRARRKRSPRQRQAEARREQDAREAGKALQEVYRRLAMTLHPDLEADAAERARKTALMTEVNVAYEARDLLALLELQLRVEEVDADQAGAIAEERLQRYNRVLSEQAKQLAEELAALELPWRAQLDLAPRARLTPARVIEAIRADTETVQIRHAELRRDLESFRDARALKAWLRAETAPGRRGGDPFDGLFG